MGWGGLNATAHHNDAWYVHSHPPCLRGRKDFKQKKIVSARVDYCQYHAAMLQVAMSLFGADCYAYGLLAMGCCDIVAEADMKPYDYLALVPIVEGAGGVITDWEGDPLTWQPGSSGLGKYQGGMPAVRKFVGVIYGWLCHRKTLYY